MRASQGLRRHQRYCRGIWTRYFYDAQGNITKEARFKYIDPATGQFVDRITDPGFRPSLIQLINNYNAAVAAHQPAAGQDTVRVITRGFDAANHQIHETVHSQAYGAVTTEMAYDRRGNKSMEGTSDLRTEYVYDTFGRVLERRENDLTGRASQAVRSVFFHYDNHDQVTRWTDAAGGVTTMAYDLAGNKITETNANGHALATSDAGWAVELRGRLGFAASAADLSDSDRAFLRNLYTETYGKHIAYTFDDADRLRTVNDTGTNIPATSQTTGPSKSRSGGPRLREEGASAYARALRAAGAGRGFRR